MEGAVDNVDVVVIGAGASGLAAAYRLISFHSIDKVVLLEANGKYVFLCSP